MDLPVTVDLPVIVSKHFHDTIISTFEFTHHSEETFDKILCFCTQNDGTNPPTLLLCLLPTWADYLLGPTEGGDKFGTERNW